MDITTIISLITYKGLEKFNRYYSSYRGWVVSNEDPEGLNRVQLKVPHVYGRNTMTYWAYPKNQYSGSNHGMKITPSIADMVWVEFEFGDVRRPIYSFGHFTIVDGKNQVTDKKLLDPKNYWFKTPGGHIIQINDTEDTITINHSNSEQSVELNSSGILLNGSTNGEMINVDNLITELTRSKIRIDILYKALNAAVVATDYSGAALLASIKAVLATSQLSEDYSKPYIKDDKVKH